MKKYLVAILSAVFVLSLIPVVCLRADTTSLEITVDPELISSLYAADVERTILADELNGRFSCNPSVLVALDGSVYENFSVMDDQWSSGIGIYYVLTDPSLVNLRQNLNVSVNGVRLNYVGYGGPFSEYLSFDGVTYPDYPELAYAVSLVNSDEGCYLTLSIMTTRHMVDMYRLYNPNSGEHFYTANAGERDMLISVGWNNEGIGWVAPSCSSTPVYRLYNQNGGEHHYTTSVAERDMLISYGWNDEGIGWYSDDAQRVPLYRQYNPNAFANNHNYTTSRAENDWLVSLGWQAEGIGWYGV